MKRILFLTALMCVSAVVWAQQLAFPGAVGWGRYAQGGRYGSVYHVTNLNDSGSGSLRDAVSKPNRIVVFDVSGVINITSRMSFASNLYVAGQTAPGEGVVVYGDGVTFSGADNIIVRYMKFRMGKNGSSGKDCAGVANGAHMIFDHCSFAWGLDETFSINWDSKGTAPTHITLSNCVVGQGLLSHSAGGLMQSDSITLYRNFYCDNSTRNNKVKGTNQYVNCIVYNWKDGCYLMGGDSSGKSWVNVTNNLFINGPSGGGNAITSGNSDFSIYAADNWQDRNADGVLNPYEIPRSEYSGGPTFASKPYNYPELPAWKASELIDSLLPDVGASLPYRDLADHLMVHQCRSFGKEGAIISSEYQLSIGAPTSWGVQSFDKPADTDGDGMPDAWETANGTNPSANDAMTIAANGYANIENYINGLNKDNRPLFLRKPQQFAFVSSTDHSVTLGWYDFTEGEEGFALEQLIDGTWTEVARVGEGSEAYTIEGLEAGGSYQVRLRAFAGDSFSEYAGPLTVKTQPKQAEMVDINTYEADYTWNVTDGAWDFESVNWKEGVYQDASNVLFAPAENATVSLASEVTPKTVVVNSAANVTFTGSGKIAGEGSVNKAGDGMLTVSTANTYTGPTVLHGGTFRFSTLKDGDVASGIGASSEFGQNWIWDGGTWNYTGASTSTNRSANMYRSTEFTVNSSASTVTMNGRVEGTGDLTKSGKGTLQPSSPAFFGYDGQTILKEGTLHLNYLSSLEDKKVYLGSGENTSSKLVLAGGTFTTKDANDNYCTYLMPIEAMEGTTSVFQPYRNCYIKGAFSGSGTIEFKTDWLREYFQNDFSQFYGRLIANGTGKDAQLMLENQGIPNGVVQLKGTIRMVYWKTNGDLHIGGLSGVSGTYLSGSSKNTAGHQMTWRVGGANTDETFAGVIDDCASSTNSKYNGTTTIYKEGSGDWRLTGTNVYSGQTYVEGGRLFVNGTHTTGGNYTVKDGATLGGRGTVGSKVTVQNGGTVLAGDTLVGTTYKLTMNKGVTLNKGAIARFPLFYNGTAIRNNRMAVTGTFIVNNAVLELDMDKVTEEIPDGTTFTLFTSLGTVSGAGFTTIVPERPSDHQEWDTSTLLKDGKLRVKNLFPRGDVNHDGKVDINDVVAVINHMAGTAVWEDANVNGDSDGNVDINDVVAIINIMAS